MENNNESFSDQMQALVFKIRTGCVQLVKLLIYGLLCGTLVGFTASIFALGIDAATNLRAQHPWVIFLMPVGAAVIIFFYMKFDRSEGTDTVLLAVTRSESVPGTLAPLIFCSTITSHFLGASVGREGAALQIGGCMGDELGKRLHFQESARRIMVMAGMSAAFSALFGTPLAATVIAMEISHVGLLQYDALVPCVIAALPSYYISGMLGVEKHPWGLSNVTPFSLPLSLSTFVLAFLCAIVSVLFVVALGRIPALAKKIPAHPVFRGAIVAAILLGMTLLSGGQFYNGAGGHVITECLHGEPVPVCAFLLKILFTAVSVAAGFKGGEIVPALFIGATFGSVVGPLLGLPGGLAAAIGMGCLFSCVTNCPLGTLLICFEMFGFEGWPYYLLSIAIAYTVSGNYGLYHHQKIRYGKFKIGREDANAHH
ncbi:MAG: chloride channel protein [Lachnospiraceae bacterium]|nr:chloride channel protein [Lachnospiraceae bacterium]